MATTVATPLERHLGPDRRRHRDDLVELASASTRITLQFGLDRDIDGAARDVQAAINAARADLPTQPAQQSDLSQGQPGRRADPDPRADLGHADARPALRSRATTVLQQKLSQVDGVGEVDSAAARCRRCGSSSTRGACSNTASASRTCAPRSPPPTPTAPRARSRRAASTTRSTPTTRRRKAANTGTLVVAYRNGAAVRLSDVAEVDDSVENVRNAGLANGKPAVLVDHLSPARRQHHRARSTGCRRCCRSSQASIPPRHRHLRRHRPHRPRSAPRSRDVERTLVIAVDPGDPGRVRVPAQRRAPR